MGSLGSAESTDFHGLSNPSTCADAYIFRTIIHYNDTLLAALAVANVAISYAVAFVLAVFVEFPLGNLEMAVFKLLGVSRRESARHGTEAQTENRNGIAAPLKHTNYSA